MVSQSAILHAGRAVLHARGLDAAIWWLATRQHGVAARRQLLELGLSGRRIGLRIERGYLRPLFAGVYLVGHGAITAEARRLAGVLAIGPDSALSGLSAGEHLRIIRRRDSRIVHVTCPRALRSRPGLTVHRDLLLPGETIVREGIPLTAPARTLLDLAASSSPYVLQRAVHEAEVQRVCFPTHVQAMLERHPRARGARALRAVVAMASGAALPTRSELEDRYLRFLVARGHRLPETNVAVHTPRGRYEVDCLWRDVGLVVELDGARYHATGIAQVRDAAKDRALAAMGMRVMHVTWEVLDHAPDELHADTLRALAAR